MHASNDEFIEINGKPDIIITDPPRDGMHKKVVQQILKIQSKRSHNNDMYSIT